MSFRWVVVATALLGSLASAALAQEPAASDRVEMVKQSFTTSQAALRQYGWVETVVLTLSGEEKVRQQYQCYYGAEAGRSGPHRGQGPGARAPVPGPAPRP